MKWIKNFFNISRMLDGDVDGQRLSSKQLYKNTFTVAWPAMLEAILVALVGIVDTIMVGTMGDDAIAAIGLTNQPRFIALAIFLSLQAGVTAVVARRKGQNDPEDANAVLRQSLIISILLSIVAAVLFNVIAKPLLLFAGADANETLDLALPYFNIIMWALPVNAITMCINAAQRGCGNTRISFVTNVTANVINVIFNYLLINGVWIFPRMGVSGAAVATVLGNLVAMLIALYSVCRTNGFLQLTLRGSLKITRKVMSSVIKVSSSAAVEQLFMRIGFFMYAKIVANLGTQMFATHQIGMQLASFSFCFGDGLSIAASSLVGQALGQKRQDLAKAYGAACQRIGLCIACVLFVLFITMQGNWFRAFTNTQEVITSGNILVVILAFICPAQISQVITSGCLRGAGDTKFVAIMSFICIGVLRPLEAYLLCYPLGMGLAGAWYSFLFDQYLRLLLSFWRFYSGRWTKIKL